MLTTQDILNLSLAIGFLILVGFVSYAAYHLAQTLKSIKHVADDVGTTTRNVEEIADSFKLGALGIARNILGGLNGRG